MLLLKLFMYFLRPSDERLRKKTNGTLIRMCIRLYQSILKWLLKSYRHYAISDTISIDSGRIKIVHEFLDPEFENELRRNNIDVRQHMIVREMPFTSLKSKHDYCFKYFKWEDCKSIYIEDNGLFIKHDDYLSVNGNVLANIQSSSTEDIIVRSIVKLQRIKKEPRNQTLQESIEVKSAPRNKTNKRPNNGLFRGERIREIEKPQNGTEASSKPEEEQRITKRGFEIDTTF